MGMPEQGPLIHGHLLLGDRERCPRRHEVDAQVRSGNMTRRTGIAMRRGGESTNARKATGIPGITIAIRLTTSPNFRSVRVHVFGKYSREMSTGLDSLMTEGALLLAPQRSLRSICIFMGNFLQSNLFYGFSMITIIAAAKDEFSSLPVSDTEHPKGVAETNRHPSEK